MTSEQLTQNAIEPSSDSAETVGEKWNLSSSTMLSQEKSHLQFQNASLWKS